jgi:hypothetical protein
MDIFTVLFLKFSAATVAKVVGALMVASAVIGVLTFERVKAWFREKQALRVSPHVERFTLQQPMENGDFATVMGLFDRRTNHVIDVDAVRSHTVDPALQAIHRNHQIALLR